jgi:hypothetical protein
MSRLDTVDLRGGWVGVWAERGRGELGGGGGGGGGKERERERALFPQRESGQWRKLIGSVYDRVRVLMSVYVDSDLVPPGTLGTLTGGGEKAVTLPGSPGLNDE